MDDRERIQAAVGATAPVLLADGKSYRFEPLTIGDYEEVDRFVRSAPLRQLSVVLSRFPADIQKHLVDRAYHEMRAMSVEGVAERIKSVDVLRYMAWLMIRHNHPDVTLEGMDRLITLNNRELIERQMEVISGLADPTLRASTEKPDLTGRTGGRTSRS